MDADLRDLFRHILEAERPLAERKAMMNELRKLAPPDENRWNFRFVIWTLALVALSVPVSVLLSAIANEGTLPRSLPEGLLSLGSAAVGALAAFLSPQRRREDPTGKPEAKLSEAASAEADGKPPGVK